MCFLNLSLDEGVEGMSVFGIMHRVGLRSLVSVLLSQPLRLSGESNGKGIRVK